MRVILEVTQGPQEGERFVFEQHEAFVVGRKKNQRVQFRIPNDPYFSRYHFMIEISPPDCFLRDLGSTNHTYVNGSKVRDAHLKDGDVIRGGRTEMKLRIEQPKPAAEPLPGQDGARVPPPSEAAGVDMETRVFGRAPSPGELRCMLCDKPAQDTQLGELTETRMIAYVCPACRQAQRDPQRPVPNYEKLAVLGRGALGPVYKARRIPTDKLVALKLISPEMAANPQAAKLFLRQMLLAASLDHPRIVPVVEMGQAGSDLWIATEFVDGLDAAKLAGQLGGTLPPADAVEIICQTLEALDHAHGRNLVHRDVKPSNVMVTGRPGAYVTRLADFGLMKNMDEAGVSGITRKGELRGTVPFMPPEQVLDCRFVRPAGDVYSAGATLYWLLTGEFVHDFEARDPHGEPMDPYLIILDDPIVPIRQRDPSVPEPLAEVIETALADEPENRHETAAAMARALQRALP